MVKKVGFLNKKITFNFRCSYYNTALLKSLLFRTEPFGYETTERIASSSRWMGFNFSKIKNPWKACRTSKFHALCSADADSGCLRWKQKLPHHPFVNQDSIFPFWAREKWRFFQATWLPLLFKWKFPASFLQNQFIKHFLWLNQIYKNILKIIITIIIANIPCSCCVPSCMLRFFFLIFSSSFNPHQDCRN